MARKTLLWTLLLVFSVSSVLAYGSNLRVIAGYANSTGLNDAVPIAYGNGVVYTGSLLGDGITALNATTMTVISYFYDARIDGAFVLHLHNNTLFVGSVYNQMLVALNVSNPVSITWISNLTNYNALYGFYDMDGKAGGSPNDYYLYTAAANTGNITLINASNPASMSIVSTYYNTTDYTFEQYGPVGVRVSGDYVYYATTKRGGFRILNTSGYTLRDVRFYDDASINYGREIDAQNNIVYVVGEHAAATVGIYNVSSVTSPTTLSHYSTSLSSPHHVVVYNNSMLIANMGADNVQQVNITNLSNPVLYDYTTDPTYLGDTEQVHISYPYAFATGRTSDSIARLNISDFYEPVSGGGGGSGTNATVKQAENLTITSWNATALNISYSISNNGSSSGGSNIIVNSGLSYPEWGGYQFDVSYKQAATAYNFTAGTVTGVQVPMKWFSSQPTTNVTASIRTGVTTSAASGNERVCNSTTVYTGANFTNAYVNKSFEFSGCTLSAGVYWIEFRTTQPAGTNGLLIPLKNAQPKDVFYNSVGATWTYQPGAANVGMVHLLVNGSAGSAIYNGSTLYNGSGAVLYNGTLQNVSYTDTGLTPGTVYNYYALAWGYNGTSYVYNTTSSSENNASGITAPEFVNPTPADGAANNTQVTLNASCSSGTSTYLWFDSSSPPSALVVNASLNSSYTTSAGANGVYYYRAACWYTNTGFSANTSVRSWVYDIVAPSIVFNPENEFNSQNYSLQNQYDNVLNLSINFTDDHDLYGAEINITRDGTVYYNWTNETLNGTSYIFTQGINATGWPAGRYQVFLAVSDSHTADAISDYQVTRKKSSITFKTANDNNIKIETRSASTITADKLLDRYTFRVQFDDGLTTTRIFDVKTDHCPLSYRPTSGYKAHFTSACGVREGGNWIDFEGVAGSPTVTRVDDYHYTVSFATVPPDVTFRSIGGMNILNATYSWYRGEYSETLPYATVGDTFTLILNMTSDFSQNLTASLVYNATERTVTKTDGANWTAFSSSFSISSNETYAYVWTVNNTQDDGNMTAFNISGNHTVAQWLIDDCSSFNNRRIRWTSHFENTPSEFLNQTFALYILYYPTSADNAKEYNQSFAGAQSFEICAAPQNLTLHMDIYAQATEPTSGYVHRFYVQNGTFAGNTTTNYSIYNFNSTTGMSQLRITARHNEDYTYYLNVLALLQRRYVGEGTWRTVQMDKSGDYGLIFFDIQEAVNDYKILFYDENNTLLLETQPVKFVCTSGVCEFTQLLSESSGSTAASGLSANYSYNTATKILTLNWTAPPLSTHTVDLLVTKETMVGANTVCSATQVGASGSYDCNLSEYNGQFFADVRTTDETLLSEWVNVAAPRLSDYLDAQEESLWGFGIAVTIVFGVGLASPVAALVALVIALVGLLFLGIMSPLTLTGVLVASAVSAYLGVRLKT